MTTFSLPGIRRILCLGAHSDDIEIGAGGTILSLLEANPQMEVCWVVFSAPGARAKEARLSAEAFLEGTSRAEILIESFRESFFPSVWTEVKERIEEIRRSIDPDVVLTHFRDDRHQDHRVLSDLAWNTFRSHLVLEYEILKYDGDLGRPNLYVPLPAKTAARKIELLLQHFESQRTRHWFSRENFEAMHRIRGIECCSASGFAEAFHARKCVLGVSTCGSGPDENQD